MKAAVISQGSTSSVMVIEAMKRYFDIVDQVQLKDIEVHLGKEAVILHEGKELGHYDCVYVKGSFRYANLLRSIATLLEKKVPYMPLPALCFTTVHNKLITHLVLQQHNIPMPKTYISSSTDAAKDILKRTHYPIVMKLPEGTQGKGVMFADSYSSASSLLDALGVLKQPFIIQEYVDTGGSDVRALVVGDKVIAAMRRRAKSDEQRANIHAGGVGEPVILTREVSALAVKTAKALGADVCGVDILEGSLGPVVVEANISPGLQGLSKVTSVDLADEIAKFFHQQTERVILSTKQQSTTNTMNELALKEDPSGCQEIITPLSFRGERIVLPEMVTRLAKLDENKEYLLRLKKGSVEIKEFTVQNL